MTPSELQARMGAWLAGEYRGVVFELGSEAIGYALFRTEAEFVYLRQLYVRAEHRRKGVARRAIDWLRREAWRDSRRVRIDVLVGNAAAIAFWRAVGFRDYCLTMEWEQPLE